jgi:PBP1b-binding outer membrane lipoprotein LpoB
MKTLRTILIVCLSALLLAGCSKKEEAEPTTPAPGPQAGPTMGEEAGSAVGQMVEGAKEKAQEALSDLKDEYTEQLQAHQSKIDALKATAKAFSDEKLDGLLESLDGKLAAAREKIGEMTSADEGAVEAMKTEMKDLMGEISKLYEQAMDRVKELQGSNMPEMPKVPGG